MMRIKLLAALSLMLLTTTFLSCKQPPLQCNSCHLLPADGQVQVSMNSQTYKMPYWETKESDTKTYWNGIGEGSTAQVKGLINWLKLPMEEQPASIVVYVNQLPAKDAIIELQNVLGCQYYYIIGGTLMHRFYYMHNGRMIAVSSLAGESNGINYNDREDLYSLYFATYNTGVSALGISDKSVKYSRCKHDDISPAIKYMYRHSASYSAGKTTAPGGGGNTVKCKKPCANTEPTRPCVEQQVGLPPACDQNHSTTSDHPTAKIAEESYNQGFQTEEEADVTFDMPLEYLFRDSVMRKSNFGRKYVDYYYALTTDAYLTPEIIAHCITVINLFNERMNWMIASADNGSRVIVDADFQREANTLIDLMASAAPNTKEKAYFTEAKSDLQRYAGYTVDQFFSSVN